jgi:hypothetical protein
VADAAVADAAMPPRDAGSAPVTVRITAPVDGATGSGVVPFTATATAAAGIAHVEFRSAGGSYLVADDTSAPYGIDWYTAGYVPDGMQVLRVVAFDARGNQASQQITVQVNNGGTSSSSSTGGMSGSSGSSGGSGGSGTLPAAMLARARTFFENHRSARYMEGNCRPTTYPQWDGIPIQMCRYTTGGLWADVILADAEPDQLARWVVQAAQERRGGTVRQADVDALCNRILEQSGAQFPVAGVVYEDIFSPYGEQEIYPFRNGVTVKISGLPYGSDLGGGQPTAAQMAAYRTGSITYVGTYGRFCGTAPSDWNNLMGTSIANHSSQWPGIVGAAYRAAWGQDRNALIVAWARSNL